MIVLIQGSHVENFNFEYFDLDEKVVIHDNTMFELRRIIVTRTGVNYQWCGHIFSRNGGSQYSGWWFDWNMHNVPIQVDDITNNMSYTYTYTLSYVCLDGVDVDTIRKKSTKLGFSNPCTMRETHNTSHCI